jgi:hypothetical protein
MLDEAAAVVGLVPASPSEPGRQLLAPGFQGAHFDGGSG